ncbi:hypothetical protein [Saccharomonospora cyanea]|uniref:Uncharacterized protein n=1 Tax=Saccharomonospora cyanea NA-134 TaxID=882082 RepID=H5XJX1_9PSEU|nr:hypothetical protein [Saccharomonospora cyanea]EHR61886.1 hypothetical protein SaccyDRAFT_3046 [Saccharomonospora cyanea NA-134]
MPDDTFRPDETLAAVSWQRWPEALRTRGQDVLTYLNAGHPQDALEVIDELLADLLARRDSLADTANRRFEPSTDDRNP